MELTREERRAAALARAHPALAPSIEGAQRQEFFLKVAPFLIPGAPEVAIEGTEARVAEAGMARATGPGKFTDALDLHKTLEASGGKQFSMGSNLVRSTTCRCTVLGEHDLVYSKRPEALLPTRSRR